MDKIGFIEIRIKGSKGNIELTPDNYDIREIISMLENAEDLLYPGDKKERPTISYKIEEGSVKHILKTSIQYIIGFNAVIGQINQSQNIDFLDVSTAKAFENIQDMAMRKGYIFTLKTSLENSCSLSNSPKNSSGPLTGILTPPLKSRGNAPDRAVLSNLLQPAHHPADHLKKLT